MKKILLSAVTFLTLATAVVAQQTDRQMPPMRDGVKSREMHKDFYKDLNLTESQQKKMEALKTEGIEQRNKINANTSLSKEEKMQAMRELQKNMQEKRNAILTPGQRTQMNEKMQEMKQKRENEGQRFGSQKGEKRGKWTNLTDAQKEQVRSINETYQAKEKEIESNTFLSKDAKQNQLNELRKQKKSAIDNVLTPEQKQQMKDGKKQQSDQRMKRTDRPNLRS